MAERQPVYIDPEWLDWTAVGPVNDPRSHLMAWFFFGTCPMVMHAVEAEFCDDGRMIAKAPVRQNIVYAAEMVIGSQTPLRVAAIEGRQYVMVAVPNIDGRRFS